MDAEKAKRLLDEHTKKPFPSMPEGFELWAEFVMLDADVAGELHSIAGKGRDHFEYLEGYRKDLEQIQMEVDKKGFKEVNEYLSSISNILDSF